jgi:hypothetical protein
VKVPSSPCNVAAPVISTTDHVAFFTVTLSTSLVVMLFVSPEIVKVIVFTSADAIVDVIAAA